MAKLAETIDQAIGGMADREGKYLTFALAKFQGGVKILLDIDRVLSRDEVALIKKAA